jgi:general secretion pathway protein H
MREDSGFTLTELVVVMTITTLIMALSLPYLQSKTSEPTVEAFSRRIETHLMAARMEAILKRRTVTVTVKLIEPRALLRDDNTVLEEVPRPAKIATRFGKTQQQGGENAIYSFFADGSSSGGTILVSDGKGSELIVVNWLTGLTERNPARPGVDNKYVGQ